MSLVFGFVGALQQQTSQGLPWWLWLLLILIVLALLIWWLSRQTPEEEIPTVGSTPAPSGYEVVRSAAEPVTSTAAATADGEEKTVGETLAPAITSPGPSDLSRIEGIGPAVNDLLQNAGIHTFEELANTEVSRLEEILAEAELAMLNPGTWPEQARLAADGRWEELAALAATLRSGERT